MIRAMKFTLTLLALASIFFSAEAQRTCGSMQYLQEQMAKDPALYQKMQDQEIELKKWEKREDSLYQKSAGSLYTIPVVFHILYNNSASDPTNISMDQILSQLDVLNEDFRATNADITTVPSGFTSSVADMEIEFCLAAVDPNGLGTTGVTRTLTTTTVFTSSTNDAKFTSMGGKDIWDRNKYLNIWVVPGLVDGDGDGLLGYGQFPGNAANTDGVVCLTSTIGRPPFNTAGGAYDLGRTTTHEVGHWLNLKHIWGDDCGDGIFQCAGTDNVSDTPNQECSNGGCPTYPLYDGCNSTSPGVMFMNYMDYVNDACMVMFSNGQRTRARAALSGSRSSILTNSSQICCPYFWNVNNETFTSSAEHYFRSSFQLTSNSNHNNGSDVIYQAPQRLKMLPGFNAYSGSRLQIRLDDCNDLIEQ